MLSHSISADIFTTTLISFSGACMSQRIQQWAQGHSHTNRQSCWRNDERQGSLWLDFGECPNWEPRERNCVLDIMHPWTFVMRTSWSDRRWKGYAIWWLEFHRNTKQSQHWTYPHYFWFWHVQHNLYQVTLTRNHSSLLCKKGFGIRSKSSWKPCHWACLMKMSIVATGEYTIWNSFGLW
jgi:hypothetical protein